MSYPHIYQQNVGTDQRGLLPLTVSLVFSDNLMAYLCTIHHRACEHVSRSSIGRDFIFRAVRGNGSHLPRSKILAFHEDSLHSAVHSLFGIHGGLYVTAEEDRRGPESAATSQCKRVLERRLFSESQAGSTRKKHATQPRRRPIRLQSPPISLSVL